MDKKPCFKRFGTMLDCSRNAVMSVKSVKRWIDLTADLGYNAVLLYIEDTFEVDDNPYFGYMRGRYTKEELKELDRYSREKGMELIPCTQTLAHLNAIVRWPAYSPHVDTGDILLAGDEAVYGLIDKMFASLSECFASRVINVGMDEAHMIGRGKYYDLHGDSNRSQILLDHLNRVAQIGKKYGFTLEMWSDMFFELAAGSYYNADASINPEVGKQIPDNVRLIYWDYYSTDKSRYDRMIGAHKKIKADTGFAGGFWTWEGFTPHNGYSMLATEAAVKSCLENGIEEVFFTMWGDDGGECSKYAMLPTLFYAAQLARGNQDMEDIKRGFQEKFGIAFDDFMLLDLPGTPGGIAEKVINPEKYLLYNDCFTGLMDSTLSGGENEQYKACAEKLAPLTADPQWGTLFGYVHALCEVLSVKAELGAKTHEAYKSGDRLVVSVLLADYEELLEKLNLFYHAYKKQWFSENKPHGFDVQDIRLGGLIMRTKTWMERLKQYADGEIDVIEELEEKQLDFMGGNEKFGKEHVLFNSWRNIVTANVMAW